MTTAAIIVVEACTTGGTLFIDGEFREPMCGHMVGALDAPELVAAGSMRGGTRASAVRQSFVERDK